MTLQQTGLILNLSGYKLTKWSQCKDVMSLIEEIVRIELDRLCGENACQRNRYTINFNDSPHARDVHFWYWIGLLPEPCIREINESIKKYLLHLVSSFRLQSTTDTSRLNFGVTHCGNSIFMLNYVYFEL